jgi:exodeoxyribonuclease III
MRHVVGGRILLLSLVCAALVSGCRAPEADTPRPSPPDVIRVMTFNLWHGGEAGKQPLEQSVRAIEIARADIVGLQETDGLEREGSRTDNGPRLAEMLGWHYVAQGSRTGILSRWPVAEGTPSPTTGVLIHLPSGRRVRVFNVHLAHAPYQPYQLLSIPYEKAPFLKTSEEAVAAARAARGEQMDATLVHVREALARDEVVVLTGDFNEPSDLDWTPRAADARLVPLAVPYPATRAVEAAGLRDAFRTVHPDEVGRPGRTWTPITRPDDPKDRHDRIDLVFVGGLHVTVTACEIVGEHADTADIVVEPWPSDHRAVVATMSINDQP